MSACGPMASCVMSPPSQRCSWRCPGVMRGVQHSLAGHVAELLRSTFVCVAGSLPVVVVVAQHLHVVCQLPAVSGPLNFRTG